MGKPRFEQLFGVLSSEPVGVQTISGSLTVNDVLIATEFSGSGAGLTNIPASAIIGNLSSQWLLSNNTLYTSQSYLVSVTGSLTVHSDDSSPFVISRYSNGQELFKVSSSGIVQMYVHDSIPTGQTDFGQMYFTTESFYVSLA
jgi:hypothetical protein